MTFTKSQLALVLACIALVALLYIFGQRRSLDSPVSDQMTSGMVMPKMNDDKELLKTQIDISALSERLKAKINPTTADSITYWEQQFQQSEDTAKQIQTLKQIARLWEKEGYLELGANYYRQIARSDSTQSNWKEAADKLADAFQLAGDSTMRLFLIENAIDAYQKTLKFDTSQLEIKVNIANCYFDAYSDNPQMVMAGVMLLRGVTNVDSTHIPANLSLGRMSIVSGQFDKAVLRFQTIIRKDPSNAEAYYYLGESYAALGQKEKAKEAFENCKKLIKNPNFAAELDKYIQQL
ncbi:MAG: tetratricopeptide repeat protein [Sphingobacteriales bacterium]|nr:MAG: tetratricopeptide repeat protein [Sphingobacteriales bacterium]